MKDSVFYLIAAQGCVQPYYGQRIVAFKNSRNKLLYFPFSTFPGMDTNYRNTSRENNVTVLSEGTRINIVCVRHGADVDLPSSSIM